MTSWTTQHHRGLPANHVKKRWYKQLYFWVLTRDRHRRPPRLARARSAGVAMEPIGTTFVTAMKMLIGPIVFLTIVGGIASVADLKKVGVDRH